MFTNKLTKKSQIMATNHVKIDHDHSPAPHAQSEHLTHPKYRPDIDGLRAIAVLAVVGFHAFPSWIKGGFIGVDIFFVISGFLISTIIFGSLKRDAFSFVEFYRRRINRIFPALLLVLIASFTLGWFVLLAEDYKQLGKHIASSASFLSNFVLWKESGYFDNAAETKPLLHLWSLGIEEQYYIVWPLLVWFAWKRNFNLLQITVIVGLLSFALNIGKVQGDLVATFYSPQTRFWELLIGSVLAYITLYNQNILARLKLKIEVLLSVISNTQAHSANDSTLRNIQSTIGAALIAIGVLVITKERYFPGWWALLPTTGAALIISAGMKAWINRAVLSNRLLVWFGLISFPLYLWHWPLLSFARIVEGAMPSREIRIAVVLISIVLAWLTYRLIEMPLRFGRFGKVKTITMLVLMVIVGYAGYSLYRSDGLTFRFLNAEMQLKQLNWDDSKNASSECKGKYPGEQYCNITNINTLPDAVIIGDSHANHFYWGLSEYYKTNNKNLLNLGAGACPPFLDVDRGRHPVHGNLNCYSRTKPMYDYVLKNKNIKTVFLSFHHSEYFRNDVEFIDKLNLIHGDDNYKNSSDALLRTIKTFESAGKNVVLIYDMPELNMDIKNHIKGCFYNRIYKQDNFCDLSNLTFIADFDKYKPMISEIQKNTSVKIFNTHQYIDGNFPVDNKGMFNYRDGTHLSINGSLFFTDKYSFLVNRTR
jgi:peptidoglycan/LPS O-acetylase OafA/YrhL